MDDLLRDLAAEHRDLDDVLTPACWDVPTPAPGWSVRDQISHLAFFDGRALLAATDPDAFVAERDAITSTGAYLARHLDRGRSMSGPEVLDWWRAERAALLTGLARLDPKARMPWYGPPMGVASCATARLMETWAHGQDIVDALGAVREPTDRLRHIAFLGTRTLAFSYQVRGLDPPGEPVRVELRAPSGATWEFGPADAVDRVVGDALDFCLVVTQRRHPDDTGLRATGPVASRWLGIAQIFAGPPGPGRQKGQFG